MVAGRQRMEVDDDGNQIRCCALGKQASGYRRMHVSVPYSSLYFLGGHQRLDFQLKAPNVEARKPTCWTCTSNKREGTKKRYRTISCRVICCDFIIFFFFVTKIRGPQSNKKAYCLEELLVRNEKPPSTLPLYSNHRLHIPDLSSSSAKGHNTPSNRNNRKTRRYKAIPSAASEILHPGAGLSVGPSTSSTQLGTARCIGGDLRTYPLIASCRYRTTTRSSWRTCPTTRRKTCSTTLVPVATDSRSPVNSSRMPRTSHDVPAAL